MSVDKAPLHNLQYTPDMVKQFTSCGIMQQSWRSGNKHATGDPREGSRHKRGSAVAVTQYGFEHVHLSCFGWLLCCSAVSLEGGATCHSTPCLLSTYLKMDSDLAASCTAALTDDCFQGTQRTQHFLPGTPLLQSSPSLSNMIRSRCKAVMLCVQRYQNTVRVAVYLMGFLVLIMLEHCVHHYEAKCTATAV